MVYSDFFMVVASEAIHDAADEIVAPTFGRLAMTALV